MRRPTIVRARDGLRFAMCRKHGWLAWFTDWQPAHDAAEMHAFHHHRGDAR